MKDRFPDFLCIGAQKAGTTWLYHQLRSHPAFWLPSIKELHYFDEVHLPAHQAWVGLNRKRFAVNSLRDLVPYNGAEEVAWPIVAELAQLAQLPISDAWYAGLFRQAPEGAVVGEVTPCYSLLPQAGIDHVLRLNPQIRIIFLVRDMIDRAWSNMRMMMQNRPQPWGLDDYINLESLDDVLNRSDYNTVLTRWLGSMPESRFLLINYDDLATQPARVLDEVAAFLGAPRLERYPDAIAEPAHVGEPYAMPADIAARLWSAFRPLYEAPHPKLAGIVEGWRRRHLGLSAA